MGDTTMNILVWFSVILSVFALSFAIWVLVQKIGG